MLPDVEHPKEVKSVPKLKKPMKPRLNALPHQERSADKLEDTQSQGLLAYHGIGSGKTFNSINAAKRMKLPIMAIVPASLRNNYNKEMEAAGNPVPHKVYSYQEAVNRLKDQKFLSQAQRSLVVMDEAHRIGQVESQRSQLASLPAAKKMLLTATPIRNHPSEIAPLVNSLNPGSVPNDPSEFNKRFIESREIPVGFWGRLMGAKPGVEYHAKNMGEFSRAIKGSVDHFENLDRKDYPSFSEAIHEVPMAPKQQAAYDYMLGKYPALAYKVKHGIPPSDNEEKNFTAFFSGPRMVSNHPGAYNASATDADAPKFHKAADELEKKWKADRNFRGVVYSNFLGAGIHPMERILSARGIPYQSFTGGLSDKERAKLVKDYNEGKNPVLLLSGAGAEGLDLKGTKLMQLMEPHWNEELMDQVRGRAIRYKSHSHLPEEERHVEVQRFHAVPQRGFIGRWTAKSPHGRGVDQYLYEVAKRKRELNQPFLDALQEEGQKEASVLHIEFTDDVEKNAGVFSWASRIPKMVMAPKVYPKPPPRKFDDIDEMETGRDYSTHEIQSAVDEPLPLLDKAKPGKSLMSRLFPGEHNSRFDYSAEIANHARELTARTGVAHHPDGSVNFEHPRVKGVMDLVQQGKLQIPAQHLGEVHDEYGIWHWAASVADRSKSKTQRMVNPALLPSMGSVKTRPAFPQPAPGSAPSGPTVTGTSIAPTPG